ncbi:MAG: carboxypeptidase regulatory-like domain-containing protein [Alistipes sp.]|nr:carboxypeptidase regulatory-like domain-containing protein [Alistipes sp.]
MLPTICMAQGRLIKGIVFDANGTPFKGATVSVEGSTESFVTTESGEFEMTVSPYVKFVVANAEGYLTSRVEIDGSFLVFRLQVDKKYLENKLRAEENARLAAEREAQAKLRAEENARLAAEREAQAKLKAEEDARKAAEREAQAKLKAEEDARKAAEREAVMNASIERGDDAQSLFSKVKDAVVYAPAYQTVDLSIAVSNFELDLDRGSNVSLRYIYAKRLKPLTVGVGAGLSKSIADFPYPYLFQVPVFLYLRTNPKMDSGSIKPFFALSAGMNIGLLSDFGDNFKRSYWFANPEVGIYIPVNGDNAISVSLGCQLRTVPIVEDLIDMGSEFRLLVDLHIGYTF